jgi:hypothetical protein
MIVRADDLKPGMVLKGGRTVAWSGRSAMNENIVAIHYTDGTIVSEYGGLHPGTPVEVFGGLAG